MAANILRGAVAVACHLPTSAFRAVFHARNYHVVTETRVPARDPVAAATSLHWHGACISKGTKGGGTGTEGACRVPGVAARAGQVSGWAAWVA
jgi:hypothetical protein